MKKLSGVLLAGAVAAGCGTPESATEQQAAADRQLQNEEIDEPSAMENDRPSADEEAKLPVDTPLFRRAQPDVSLNAERLAAAGIHMLQSDRLILLTDRDPATVQTIPELADALFDYLTETCGPLRPTRQGAEFQAVGCLMSDVRRFESAGLIEDEVKTLRHGQQWGYRFWVRDQKEDYYRRHLVLHEFVHVYMTVDTPNGDLLPQWFMEAAAELYATHRHSTDETAFAVMPGEFAGFEGWGRISAIKRKRVDLPDDNGDLQPLPSLKDVLSGTDARQDPDSRYRWWWALGWMLSHHPEYRDDWTRLCHCRSQTEFTSQFTAMTSAKRNRLKTDWMLFCESLGEGFDSIRSFAQRTLADSSPATVKIQANRGWQDTGWTIAMGDQLHISSSGRCILNKTTVSWESEPNGITLEYNQGRPIGELVAVVVGTENSLLTRRIPIGLAWHWTATRPGRLWLQINDSERDRGNNSGDYLVQIRRE